MTPVSLMWFWRGLRGRSITFSVLFASLALGASISKGVHQILFGLGFHWLYVILIPLLLFRWLSSQERRWLPDERQRGKIAISILLGSIALSLGIGWVRHQLAPEPIAEPVPFRAAGHH